MTSKPSGMARAGASLGAGTAAADHEPELLTLDGLQELWGCDRAAAVENAIRHGVSLCVRAVGWSIEWGAWVSPPAVAPAPDDGTATIRPDPLACDVLVGRADSPLDRGDVGWQLDREPMRCVELVGVFDRDLRRLPYDPDAPIVICEVHGRPLGLARCGRLRTPTSVEVRANDLRVRRADAMRLVLGHAAPVARTTPNRATRELLEAILDADGPHHAPQLAAAIRAWEALYVLGWEAPTSARTDKRRLRAWLEQKSSGFTEHAYERIATVANPESGGGRPRNA